MLEKTRTTNRMQPIGHVSVSPDRYFSDPAPFRSGHSSIETQDRHAAASDERAQTGREAHYNASPLVAPFPADQKPSETQSEVVGGSDQSTQHKTETQAGVSPLVAQIRAHCHIRRQWVKAKVRLELQAQAICRDWTAGDKEKAATLFAKIRKGDAGTEFDDLIIALGPFLGALKVFEPELERFDRSLEKLAEQLPLAPWVKGVSGFGMKNLALIIGEVGEITAYRNPSCLWKRLGLAVIDGGRQRKCADADLALVHGYSPWRRAIAWNLGQSLIKKQNRYREVYEARRAHTQTTHSEWWADKDGNPKINAKTGKPSSDHGNNDALRFMTKRVLRDLWVEARRALAEQGQLR